MIEYIVFLISCSLLAFFLGVSRKKEPLIVVDDDWKYLSMVDIEDSIDFFVDKKPKSNHMIPWEIGDSYEIAFAVKRYEESKHKYDAYAFSPDWQGYLGFLVLSVIYLTQTTLSNLIPFLLTLLNVFISIVVYQLTVKFYSRNLSKDVVYIEYTINDPVSSPESFERCYEFLKQEKARCIERLTSRADAYESGLYILKYHINTFRWASTFGVTLISAVFFGFII